MRNKFFSLLKYDLLNTFAFKKLAQQSKAVKILGSIGLGILGLLILAGCFSYAFLFGFTLSSVDAMFMMIGGVFLFEAIFSLITTIRTASTYLFDFRDYDLLMSMPISLKNILAVKMSKLYLTNLLSSLVICIPFLIVNGIFTSASIFYYISAIIMSLFVPMIAIVFGAVVSFFIMKISSKFKKNNLLNIIFTLILSAGIMFASFSFSFASQSMTNIDTSNIQRLSESFWNILKYFPPALWFTKALSEGNILFGILFIVVSIALFLGFIFIFNKNFNKINISLKEQTSGKKYIHEAQKSNSIFGSLLTKELRQYFSSSYYVLNTISGGIMPLISLIILVIKFGKISSLPEINMMLDSFGISNNIFIALISVLLTFSFTISPTTVASISIEGKNFWMGKSMPVSEKQIFKSKIMVNILINIPFTVIIFILSAIFFELSLLQCALILLNNILIIVVASILGLYCNLMFPKMKWTNSNQVVKNSLSIVVFILMSFVVTGIVIALFVFTIVAAGVSGEIFVLAYNIILLLLILGSLALLNTHGVKLYNKIEA